jgi:hypothetical protein
MPNNLFMQYKNLHTGPNEKTGKWQTQYQHGQGWTKIYPAKMGQNNTQSVARTIMAEQALEIAREFPVVLLVHDEVAFLVPENDADAGLKYGLECLRTAPSWCSDLPLDAEGSHAESYGEAK